MFHGPAAHEPHEQVESSTGGLLVPSITSRSNTPVVPQRPPSHVDPARAWLGAIISQARQTDAPLFASAASTPSAPSAFASRASPHLSALERWEPPLAEQHQQPLRRLPSAAAAAMYQEQLELDDSILAGIMSLAFNRMVGEQACCFIAKGICHFCGTSERHLIPVVNFCPDFHVHHSLCREHLRSFHKVRIEDIFSGKNRPTVSKRSLQCAVCSRSCPCSTCLLEKEHEVSKYKRWLAGEYEYGLDSEDLVAGIEQAPQLRAPAPTAQPRGDFRGLNASTRPGYLTTDEIQDERDSQRQQEPYPRHLNESPPPGYEASWRAEYTRGDDLELLTSLQAGAKPPSHPFRGAKRAAKESSMLSVQTPMPLMPAISAPVESPSAAHVMNCAESEKSLVRLLTTLNQDVPPQEMPAVAEPKDSRFLPPSSGGKSSNISSLPQSTFPEKHHSASRNDVESAESHGYQVDTTVADADGSASTSSSRNSKRKRAATAHADSETSSESSATHSRGRRLPTPKRGEVRPSLLHVIFIVLRLTIRCVLSQGSASTRGAGAQSESASSSRAAGKGKAADARQRSTPKASQNGRKRRADTPSNVYPSAPEKKGPVSRRGSSKRSPESASQGRRPKRQSARAREEYEVDDESDEDEGGEDSEIDTNLDYCEVCLAAGDLVCCDVCPRSFHLSCLKLDESELPEGDWQCAECMKPSFFVRYLALVHMKQSVYGKCVETIRCLKSHPFSKQFLSPVKNIGHYRSIVKHPMDLTTIETKLKSDKYTKGSSGQPGDKSIDIESFANDIRLVWANCKLFNDDGSGITRAADELAAGFEDIYEHLRQYVSSTAKQAAKSASKTPSAPSRSSAQVSSGPNRSVPSSPSSKSGVAAQEMQQMNEEDGASKTTASKDESGDSSTVAAPPQPNSGGTTKTAATSDSGAAPSLDDGRSGDSSEASSVPVVVTDSKAKNA